MFPKTKQNNVKAAGYKAGNFRKTELFTSNLWIFSYKLPRLIFSEFRKICFQGIILVVSNDKA